MREQVAGSEAQRSLGGQERVQGLDLVVCFDLIFEARLILSGRFTQMGKTWMKHIPPSCALISPLRKEVGREQNLTYCCLPLSFPMALPDNRAPRDAFWGSILDLRSRERASTGGTPDKTSVPRLEATLLHL